MALIKSVSNVSLHGYESMASKGIPQVSPRTLLKAAKKGTTTVAPAEGGRWAYFHKGFVYILASDKKCVISGLTYKQYWGQKSQREKLHKLVRKAQNNRATFNPPKFSIRA